MFESLAGRISISDCIKADLLLGVEGYLLPTEYFLERNELSVGDAVLLWYSNKDERWSDVVAVDVEGIG